MCDVPQSIPQAQPLPTFCTTFTPLLRRSERRRLHRFVRLMDFIACQALCALLVRLVGCFRKKKIWCKEAPLGVKGGEEWGKRRGAGCCRVFCGLSGQGRHHCGAIPSSPSLPLP